MRFPLLLVALCTLLSPAWASGPAARLQAALPTLFPVGSVADTLVSGMAAAHLRRASEAALALGLHEDDWILAVEGQMLEADVVVPATAAVTLTVARGWSSGLPVLPPEALGRQGLEQFMALPPAERVPMRLARMLANQQTLATLGFGIILVPEASNQDDATWLRLANPLPPPSEEALAAIRQALDSRVALPPSPDGEAAAAARLLAAGDVLEARELAMRAVVAAVATPASRQEAQAFDAARALYQEATGRLEQERRAVLSPGRRFAFVLETLFNASSQPLGQDILFVVDGSNDFSIAAGFNLSLHRSSPHGGWPVLRDLDLLAEYAYTARAFAGPDGADEVPSGATPPVRTRLTTAEHRMSLELTYRPRLRSRLRPMLRGGPALFRLGATALDENGAEREHVGVTTWGWLGGGGLDVYQHRRSGLRASLVGSYQRVVHEFCPDEAPGWEAASNIPGFDIEALSLARPSRRRCVSASNPEGNVYRFDLSAWQAGLMLTLPF